MRRIAWIFLTCSAAPVWAQTDVGAPGTLSTDHETYRLTQDIDAEGTAFTISGDGITFDLNGHVINYNTVTDGPGIVVTGNDNQIKNGYIIQGADRSPISPAIKMTGSGHVVSYLGIQVEGVIEGYDQLAAGIETYASRSEIHHVYIENFGSTNHVSFSPRGIYADHRTTAGFSIHDNIIYHAHQGVSLTFVGLSTETPEETSVFNNFIQHVRTPGTKSPYGIALGKCRNVKIFDNQVISDDGRGIICDGLGQGVPRGTDYIEVYNNRVDVEYRVVADSGPYVENDVYGIRDRYSSGNNSFHDNIIMVNNEAGGVCTGFFIGSDAIDSLMVNLDASNNQIIARDDNANSSAIRYAVAEDLSVTGNTFVADHFSIDDWAYTHDGGIGDLQVSNNDPFVVASYSPAAPSGLRLARFFDSYVLMWNDNEEAQTFEYIVYRDGSPLDISPRGGTFFVDGPVSGTHVYSLVARNLNGDLSSPSISVSTADAAAGWAEPLLGTLPPGTSPPEVSPPSAPSGLEVH